MAWECSATEDSPMTARRVTTSSDQLFWVVGNHVQLEELLLLPMVGEEAGRCCWCWYAQATGLQAKQS